jgi:hypothetical protein
MDIRQRLAESNRAAETARELDRVGSETCRAGMNRPVVIGGRDRVAKAAVSLNAGIRERIDRDGRGSRRGCNDRKQKCTQCGDAPSSGHCITLVCQHPMAH